MTVASILLLAVVAVMLVVTVRGGQATPVRTEDDRP